VRLVAATGNAGKLAEIRLLLAEHEIVGRPPMPDPIEDGETLLENARIKARAVVDATGEPAVADDTGLFVDALDGAPGVQTARYAGEGCTYEDNWRKLLRELDDRSHRRARWETVAFVLWPDGRELWSSGDGREDRGVAPGGRGPEPGGGPHQPLRSTVHCSPVETCSVSW
jgi:XTP/dITP diphosphohydrolase